MVRTVVLDTETTGLRPEGGDRLVEIGCIELIDMQRSGKQLHLTIDPERPIPADATRIHGISDADVAGKPKFKDIAGELTEFIGDAAIVAHNADFDLGFLRNEYRIADGKDAVYPLAQNQVIDTVGMARRKFPGQRASLDALCDRFGIDRERRKAEGHGALLDADLLVLVYQTLVGGVQHNLLQESGGQPAARGLLTAVAADYSGRQPRYVTVSAEESVADATLMAELARRRGDT